jgi:hypothetical protein
MQRADVALDLIRANGRGCVGALCLLLLACAAPAVREPVGAGASGHDRDAGRGSESGAGGMQSTSSAGHSGKAGAPSTSPRMQSERPDASSAGAGGMNLAMQPRPDAGAQQPHAGAPATDHPVDKSGYAVVGDDVYPPLYERVEAVACEDVAPLPSQCSKDDDCGAGFACLCGILQGLGTVLGGQCVPAECRSASDCDGGRCLLSLGNRSNDCCTYGKLGLFCSREASTCHDGGDCPGNGIACMYDEALDHFECKPFGCQCR